MRIDVYEILSTNSLSGSRIIFNDNFRMLADGINALYNNIDIDDHENMSIHDIKKLSANEAEINVVKTNKISNSQKVCMSIDEHGHLILLDENGSLTLDVNQFIIDQQNQNNEEDEN